MKEPKLRKGLYGADDIPVGFAIDGQIITVPQGFSLKEFNAFRAGYERAHASQIENKIDEIVDEVSRRAYEFGLNKNTETNKDSGDAKAWAKAELKKLVIE